MDVQLFTSDPVVQNASQQEHFLATERRPPNWGRSASHLTVCVVRAGRVCAMAMTGNPAITRASQNERKLASRPLVRFGQLFSERVTTPPVCVPQSAVSLRRRR